MGAFNNNVAKSNGDNGMRFTYHQSGEEIVIVKAKSIKNRNNGVGLFISYNMTLKECIFSENTRNNIEIRFSEKIQIQDTVMRGYTSETKALVQPPYFNRPCKSPFYTPVGLKVPTSYQGRSNGFGVALTNVIFTDFDSDDCEKSIPIIFNSVDKVNNHFDYLTMFRNVTIEGDKIMDALSSYKEDVKDILVHDIDGSSDPSGKVSPAGMFVSNVNWLKAFAGGSCTKLIDGISYCANSCYRTVSFMIDQSDSDFDLRITRQTDGKNIIAPYTYKYDDDQNMKHYSEHFRYFSISLPSGSYRLEFLKNLQPAWPSFVLQRWEGTPECEGYLLESQIDLVHPYSTCDNLIFNGDMKDGTNYWLHRNGGNSNNGLLLAAEDGGLNDSATLRHSHRSSVNDGVGQNLDMRCLNQSLGEYYEIELYFRLEHDTSPFICDPYSTSWDVRCPDVLFQQQRYVSAKFEKSYSADRANVVIPNSVGHFNLMHGVFKVDESLLAYDRIFMYLATAHKSLDFIIDNMSVKKLPGVCVGDLVRNGGLEENSKYWKVNTVAQLGIETLSNKALKVFNRRNKYAGASQDLFVDKSCFKKKRRYAITGKIPFHLISCFEMLFLMYFHYSICV